MGVEYLQSNLTGGELAPTLHARTDIDKYASGVAIAENVIIVPQGGMRRRPGLQKLQDGYVGEVARLIPFVFNKKQQYLLVYKVNKIDILKDGVNIHTVDTSSAYKDMDTIRSLDIIQSADTVIMTTETIAPHRLIRGATDADWTFEPIPLTIPDYEFTAGTPEPVWSDTRGWPQCCTFHMGRLWFAGSTQKPTSVWGSRINGFFDFTAQATDGVIPDDHAIFDTIDSDRYNKILNIFSARGLQVFTTGAEYYNTVDVITPANSGWKQQTGYGSKGVRPIFIDGATLFVDSSKRNIREFVYSLEEDAHVSNSVTLLASHLLTDVVSLQAIKGTNVDISDFVYAVNADGSVAVMNTLRNEGILGWTHWTTQGEFADVCVLDKTVYFLVKRHEQYFIEKLDEYSYTDHNTILKGTKPETKNVIQSPDNVIDTPNNVVYLDNSTGIPVSSITTDYKDLFLNTYFKVVADYSMMADAKPITDGIDKNHFDIPRNAYRIEVGLDFQAKVVTLPLSPQSQSGSTLHRRKRVVKAEINVFKSLGVYVRDIYSPDRTFTVVLDAAPTPFTGFKEMYLLGYNRITQLEITQKNPLPFLIRGIGYELTY